MCITLCTTYKNLYFTEHVANIVMIILIVTDFFFSLPQMYNHKNLLYINKVLDLKGEYLTTIPAVIKEEKHESKGVLSENGSIKSGQATEDESDAE